MPQVCVTNCTYDAASALSSSLYGKEAVVNMSCAYIITQASSDWCISRRSAINRRRDINSVRKTSINVYDLLTSSPRALVEQVCQGGSGLGGLSLSALHYDVGTKRQQVGCQVFL